MRGQLCSEHPCGRVGFTGCRLVARNGKQLTISTQIQLLEVQIKHMLLTCVKLTSPKTLLTAKKVNVCLECSLTNLS